MSYSYQQSHQNIISDKFKTLYHLPKINTEQYNQTYYKHQRNNSQENLPNNNNINNNNSNLANFGQQLLFEPQQQQHPQQRDYIIPNNQYQQLQQQYNYLQNPPNTIPSDRSEQQLQNEIKFLNQADVRQQIKHFYQQQQNQAHQLQSTEFSVVSSQKNTIDPTSTSFSQNNATLNFSSNLSQNSQNKFKPKLKLKKHLVLHIDYLHKLPQNTGKVQIKYKITHHSDLDLDIPLHKNLISTEYFSPKNQETVKIQLKKLFPQFTQTTQQSLHKNNKSISKHTQYLQQQTFQKLHKKKEQCYIFLQLDIYNKITVDNNQSVYMSDNQSFYQNTKYNNDLQQKQQEIEYLDSITPNRQLFTIINIYDNSQTLFNEGKFKLRTYELDKFKILDILDTHIPDSQYNQTCFMVKLTQEDKSEIDNYQLYSPYEYKLPIIHDYKKRTFQQRQQNILHMQKLHNEEELYNNNNRQSDHQSLYNQELVKSLVVDIEKDIEKVNQIQQIKQQQQKQFQIPKYIHPNSVQNNNSNIQIYNQQQQQQQRPLDKNQLYYSHYNIDKNYHLEYLQKKKLNIQQLQNKYQFQQQQQQQDNLSSRSSKLDDYFFNANTPQNQQIPNKNKRGSYLQQQQQQQQYPNFQQQQQIMEESYSRDQINDTPFHINTANFKDISKQQQEEINQNSNLNSVRTPPPFPGKGFDFNEIQSSQKEFYNQNQNQNNNEQQQQNNNINGSAPYTTKNQSKNDSFQIQGQSKLQPYN